MISWWIFTVASQWKEPMTHLKPSHLIQSHPLIVLSMQTLFDSYFCLSITSSFFAPSEEYVDSIKDMQICGQRWMWLSDVSYNLSDMLFQRRMWGGPHETFIFEEWLRRDIDENRDDRKREHNSQNRMLMNTWKCYIFQKPPIMECGTWYTCV